MIDNTLKPYYDKILSVFIGVVLVLIVHNLYDYPRTIMISSLNTYKNKKSNKYATIHCLNPILP
jgi:hypothetical protein